MRTKVAQIGIAYGLSKTQQLLKFRPVNDIMNSLYHGIRKFFTSLLTPLAQNDCC